MMQMHDVFMVWVILAVLIGMLGTALVWSEDSFTPPNFSREAMQVIVLVGAAGWMCIVVGLVAYGVVRLLRAVLIGVRDLVRMARRKPTLPKARVVK